MPKVPSSRPSRTLTPQEIGKAQLQDLYNELDRSPGGDHALIRYAQLRAMEHTHDAAVIMVLDHYRWTPRNDRPVN